MGTGRLAECAASYAASASEATVTSCSGTHVRTLLCACVMVSGA